MIIIYLDNNLSGFPVTEFNHMDRERKKYLRGILFRHLDGIALCSTISTLHNKGVTQHILDNPSFNIQQLLNKFECNVGYLNVSLRLMASQGWLERNIIHDGENIEFQLTEKGQKCLSLAHHYDTFCQFIPILIHLDRYLFDPNAKSIQDDFQNLFDNLEALNTKHKSPNTPGWEICRQLEGVLIGPILVSLGMSEYFLENIEDNREINNETIGSTLPVLKSIMDFFITLGWLKYDNNNYYFTDEGLFFIKRSTAYGVTVSYLPTFNQIPELLFGNPNILWKRSPEGLETHVNRRMNVWGSGEHTLYILEKLMRSFPIYSINLSMINP